MKYIKLKSVTFWSGFVPFACGVFLAAEPIHQMAEWVSFVSAATGEMPPYVLINAGLALIGLRAAPGVAT